ncbi:hypothetical protein DRE_03430 [Drechslerella stenobrocha 248]|uniref:Extracellular membrane protein CFEM domain-containing protein n=1 Tax=Drechslerella stenobrocha 248 TaxID=1043628 RepID=W7HT88_9PEZI|nr:hypothetical protein DRE_03430 [Drechslerella stenobrocha 248]
MRFILLSVALSSLGRVIASNSPPPAATITPPPSRLSFAKALLPRQADGPYACSWFNTLFEQCSNAGYSQDAGVSGLPYCLCYGSNDRYDPYKADSYIEQCYNYAGTDTSFASGFATYLDLCSSAGDVRAAESSSYAACAAVNSIFSRCADYGYDRVVGPSQPAAYAQTADPELAGSMWLNLGYCSRGGDVQAALSQGTQLCKSVASVLKHEFHRRIEGQ